MEKPQRSESQILSSVLALLKARGIFAIRMNLGKMKNPNGQWVTFGVKGCADVLAMPYHPDAGYGYAGAAVAPLWIECKTSSGKQSQVQRDFQILVESYGHQYFVVTSAEQVNRILENLSA